jgi:hypothetical protein
VTLKVKVTKSLTFKTLIPDIEKNFTGGGVRDVVVDEIRDHISEGKSPVAGKKFKHYSSGYAKIKGRKRPVDMTVSGDMLKSLSSKKTKTSFFVFFKSKIAEYHDSLGAGRSKIIRRLLPTKRGERFTKVIQNRIIKALNDAVKKAVSKSNR